MRLEGIPFYPNSADNAEESQNLLIHKSKDDAAVIPQESVIPASQFPSTSAIATGKSQIQRKVSINESPTERSSGKSLVPPFQTPKAYGAIDIPINTSIEDDDDDSDNDDDGSGGWPSEAGWSTRMHRRHSSIKSNSCFMQYLGLIFTMLYAVFSSLSGITVKLLEKDFHPFNICFWRFSTIFIISLVVILYTKLFTKRKLWPRPLIEEKHEHAKNVFLLILRGVLGCSGRILYIYSITCMTLSDAMVIASSSPVFMTFFAYFLLGESCGVVPVVVALVTLAGVGVITRPPWLTGSGSYDKGVLLGTGTGIGGMVLTTLVMIVMRKLRHVNVTLITISFASCGIIAASFLSFHNGVFVVPIDNLTHILLLIASGATSFLGQTFLALGLKYESAGVVALLTNFAVVFSFIFEYIFLHNAPDVYSISGGFIVVLCIVLITFRKWIGTLPDYHEARRIFSFLLA